MAAIAAAGDVAAAAFDLRRFHCFGTYCHCAATNEAMNEDSVYRFGSLLWYCSERAAKRWPH